MQTVFFMFHVFKCRECASVVKFLLYGIGFIVKRVYHLNGMLVNLALLLGKLRSVTFEQFILV